MNRIKTIKCLGAAVVMAAGLSATSAVAGYGGGYYGGGYYGGHHRGGGHHHGGHYYDDDDDDHYHGGHYYDDDDDDYYRRGRRHRRHRGYRGRGHRRCGYYGYYCHDEADLGVEDLTFADRGGRLEAELTITGLEATATVQVDLEAHADVRSTCAQTLQIADVFDVASWGSRAVERTLVLDDAVAVALATDDSAALAGELSTCPGARLAVEQVEFLDARIDVTHGDNVLTLLCTFIAPTTDGVVADENVECSVF